MDMFAGLFLSSTIDIVSFFLKVAIIVVALIIVIAFAMKNKTDSRISIKNLNKQFKGYKKLFQVEWMDKKELKKEEKEEQKNNDISSTQKPKSFLVHFKGDIKASDVDNLKECINAILTVAQPKDEVVVDLESPGGMVHGYGLVASQLQRIKDSGVELTICVDKVAASGGYMIACLANRIISAPFAIIGSVGVIASIPNFNKILKKNDVDFYQMTAGKYKRTMTLFGEITEEGKEKFKEELEETHELFKNHIKKFRPKVDVEAIATGEHWYGTRAQELKLVDELGTSDAYIQGLLKDRLVLEVSYKPKKSVAQKLTEGMSLIMDNSHDKILEKMQSTYTLK
jgi:serine protease SohB